MARGRSPERNKAFEIYKKNKGNITNREIANKLSISEKTIAGWKCKDKWVDSLNGVLQKDTEYSKKIRSTPKEKVSRRVTKEKSIEKEVINSVMKNNELTDKQKDFCLYYVRSFNATTSYQKAYKCNYNVANAEGYKLLVKPCVKAEILKLKELRLNQNFLSTQDLLQQYIKIAFSDITDYLTFGQKEIERETDSGEVETFNVNYVDFKNSTEVDGSLISEIKQGKDGVGIKLQDKMKALEFLSKHLGLLDMATKEKLDLAREKFEYEKTKLAEVEEENDGSLKEMLEGFRNEV